MLAPMLTLLCLLACYGRDEFAADLIVAKCDAYYECYGEDNPYDPWGGDREACRTDTDPDRIQGTVLREYGEENCPEFNSALAERCSRELEDASCEQLLGDPMHIESCDSICADE
jgi:hypothetical protein